MALEQARIFTDPEGGSFVNPALISPESSAQVYQQLQDLYQSYFPNQSLSQADLNYYAQRGGLSALMPEFEGLKPANQARVLINQPILTPLSQPANSGLDAVKQLYTSILGREADQPGLEYWASVFGSEVSPEERAAFEQAAAAEIAARPKQDALPAADTRLQDTSGYYLGAQIPTFTDRTVYTGGGEDAGVFQSASEQLSAWKAEQDRRAALTPAQRAIEDARYIENLEGGVETRYNPVTLEGSEWTVTPGGDSLVKMSQDQSGLGAKQYRYDLLDPVTGQVTQQIGVEGPGLWKGFLTNPVTGMILGLALPGVSSVIGSALGATGTAATALGSGVLNFGLQVAAGADPIDALRGAVISAGAGFAGSQVSAMLPAELASAGKNAITQLITTGKLDPAALATSVGTSFATDALAAETGVDRATAGKLITAGLQAFQGNELAALTSLAQAGLSGGLAGTGVSAQSPQDRAAFLDANASPAGLSSLSPIPAEDEQIALAQLVNKANQAIADYAGPGNDLSREGLVSQLQSFGLTADQAEGYAQKADQQINMNRVGADVMNRYSKIDPEFGTPQLDRDTAVRELVTAGYSSDRANQILNDVDAENASKLENRLNVQAAYNDLIKGTGTSDQLRSAMMLAGYTDNEINNFVTRGLGVLEGSKLTGGEQAQVYAENLPDVRAEIAAKPTFSEAYRLARDTYGSNATFTWQGKSYSTATAEERPDLSAAGLAAKALSGDPQFQVALSENAVQNQRNISQVFSDYAQKGGDLTREGALSRLESLGVTKDQASFYLDQADGKLPLLYDQFKSKVPTGSEDSYRAYILAFNELKNKGVPTSLIDVSGYAASGAKPNYPTFINAISTGFGMGAEAAGNTLKAFGTIGESLVLNTAQMSDFGRRLENIAQELYPQALIRSEDEVKARFANAKTGTDLLNAVKDSFINNPGAVAKMIGVEGIQELPNIALALATGGASAVIRYGGMLAGLGLDVVESAGLQGAQKIEEGLSKGLSRADAVKGAVDDMKKAGTVTAIMTAAADKVPFGGTIAKTAIKGSAGEGIEEYVIARSTGASHFDALRQAAFGAMIGGPTEASLQGAGNLTGVVAQGDKLIGTYEDGTKVTISEGPKDLIFDISKPSTLSADIASSLTANLNAGANLSTAINDVVVGSTDLSAAVDGTISGLLNSNVDVGAGIADLTLAASNATGNTGAAIDQVVAGLASNNADLNANAGSVVVGALSSGTSVTDAVDKTLAAVTANGGSVADSASSIVVAVSGQSNGDPASVANAGAAVIAAGNKDAVVNTVNAAVASTDGSVQVVSDLVAQVAGQNNNASTELTISTGVASIIDAGGDSNAVVDAAVNAAVSSGANVTTSVSAALDGANTTGNNVVAAVDTSVSSAVVATIGSGGDVNASIASAVEGALNSNVGSQAGSATVITSAIDSAVSTSIALGTDPAAVIQAAVDGAVSGNTDLSTAAAAAVSSAVTAGVDPSVASTVVSNVTTNVTSDNGVTIVTSSTYNSTTSVEVSGDTKIVTVVTGNQVVVTETDLDSGTSTQTTTTTSGTNTDTFVHVVPPPLGGTTQGTPVITEPKPPVSPKPPVITEPEPPVITEPVTIQPPQVTPPKEPEPKKEPPKKPTPQPSGGGGGAGALLATGASGELGRLLGQMLEAKVTNEKYIDPLANLPKLTQEAPPMNNDPRLERYLDERGSDPDSNYYSYGKVPSLDEILGGQVMAQGGQVMPLPFMYAKGGLSRQDFRQGKHVSGPGDGQSDDIPAMLADGEFVFPADVVAALGNGSTKAGTQKLYEMMHAIRQRARSTKVKDLPPPALKSPLDYLKSRK